MKQQIYEKALRDIFAELQQAQKHLGNVGRFDDYLSSVDAADDSINRAMEIYYETQKLSAPNISER